MSKLVYLGPEGTFTHQAARALAPEGVQLEPLATLEAVLSALNSGQADYAVAAYDSAAGPIALTHEAIASGQARVLDRHTIQVSFNLYRSPGDTTLLVGVYGHEKALAQCQAWIDRNGVEAVALPSSTAGPIKLRDAAQPGWGAIAPPGLDTRYGLDVEQTELEAPNRNETIFVLLERAD